ncbi:hypothetical protein CDCA_CDCA12G3384 [Cyanidium caldarium]|uniref:type I protein arginine methyltransferase n=1 Tax=Cyanidium caldarium TaxID=2771 RepID=A0AAV9IYP2_CYACA|nr:hypothetical protein CDCA_CDCA12G3384 [Cyanidium caldarium]
MEYPLGDRLPPPEPLEAVLPLGAPPGVCGDVDYELTSSDYYFSSYSHFGIHEEMLKDDVRTSTYMHAIQDNPHLFRGKVVLDVGCGTGILSLFAARAGAAKVYAVECSRIIEQARAIVRLNHYEHVIELFECRVEELQLPIDPQSGQEMQVDVIVSEWMGYFLFYESMLESVLYARDKWLRPGTGLMFPDQATLYLCAIEDAAYRRDKIDFWDSVYGFDFSCIKRIALTEPLVDYVDAEQVNTTACPILRVDVGRVTRDALDWSVRFRLTATRNDFVHALVAYFDIAFTHCHRPLGFSTGPAAKSSHWKQTVFYLDQALIMNAGEAIEGTLACRRNASNPRDLDIGLSYRFRGKKMSARNTLRYRLR